MKEERRKSRGYKRQREREREGGGGEERKLFNMENKIYNIQRGYKIN